MVLENQPAWIIVVFFFCMIKYNILTIINILLKGILDQWSSKCGFHLSSSNIAWKCVRNANSWASTQTCWIRNSGSESQPAMFRPTLQVILTHIQVWKPLLEATVYLFFCFLSTCLSIHPHVNDKTISIEETRCDTESNNSQISVV